MMYDLCARIKEAREKRGLSRRELSSKLIKSFSAISSYESKAIPHRKKCQIPPSVI